MNRRVVPFFVFLYFLGVTFAHSQDGNAGTHERWEYVLEDTGDVLQLALPLSAGLATIFQKDYEGTKQMAFSYASTMAITYALKYTTKRQRPEGRNTYDRRERNHTYFYRKLADEGMSMIIVSHEMAFVREVADKVVFMDTGQIVEAGTPAELFDNPQTDRSRDFFSKILRH